MSFSFHSTPTKETTTEMEPKKTKIVGAKFLSCFMINGQRTSSLTNKREKKLLQSGFSNQQWQSWLSTAYTYVLLKGTRKQIFKKLDLASSKWAARETKRQFFAGFSLNAKGFIWCQDTQEERRDGMTKEVVETKSSSPETLHWDIVGIIARHYKRGF